MDTPKDDTLLTPADLLALADRIAGRAKAGRVVHLKPDTARLCEQALRSLARQPFRGHLVSIICGKDRCSMRRECYSCFGRANAIMRLYAGRDQ